MPVVVTPVAPPSPAARPQRPALQRLSTGVPRLDTLLCGGFPAGTATVLYGPPFCGKQVLQQAAFAKAVSDGIPGAFILHGVGAEAMSRKLRALDGRVAQAERDGLVTYIDVHSQSLGEPTGHPNAVYVDDPRDMGKVLQTLNAAAADGDGSTVTGVVALQSASTALVDLGPTRAFQFLRTVLGRSLKHGGVALLSLQSGMHTEAEVQMAKHLCAGMVEMRKKGDAHALHIEGLETAFPRPGWIEYDVSPRGLRLTGSFAQRTIQ
jgi:KaiC/GvpD/RAD55 family RecA-like ATPase